MKPSREMHNEMKRVFLEYYENSKETPYYWTAKDARNINLLINKISFSCKAADIDNSIENVTNTFKVILERMDDWIKRNLDISLINSQYQKIISSIKSDERKSLNSYKQNLIREFSNLK